MESHNIALCFETLANELRVKILDSLKENPMNVTELTEALNVERTRVSHSLQMLRDCKLVHVTKQGKEHIYTINKDSPFFNKEQKGGLFAVMREHKHKTCVTCYKTGLSV